MTFQDLRVLQELGGLLSGNVGWTVDKLVEEEKKERPKVASPKGKPAKAKPGAKTSSPKGKPAVKAKPAKKKKTNSPVKDWSFIGLFI